MDFNLTSLPLLRRRRWCVCGRRCGDNTRDEEEEEEEDEEEEEEGEPEPLAASRATLNRRAMPLRAVVRMGEGAMKDADTGRCRATGEGGNTGLATAAANCMAGCTWTGG